MSVAYIWANKQHSEKVDGTRNAQYYGNEYAQNEDTNDIAEKALVA